MEKDKKMVNNKELLFHHGEACGLIHNEAYCAKQSDYLWKIKKMKFMRDKFFPILLIVRFMSQMTYQK